MATMLSAHPAIHAVLEPDNRDQDALGWLATNGFGVMPVLGPDDPAPDYERSWKAFFAGGWPDTGLSAAVSTRLRRASGAAQGKPSGLRMQALRAGAAIAARRPAPAPVVLVKSVRAHHALGWIRRHFEPSLVVVWRHPLNVTSAWLDRNWPAGSSPQRRDVRARFEPTAAWPPPAPEDRVSGLAWDICAEHTILLEAVAAWPGAVLLSHERSAVDPRRATAEALSALGLEWDDAVGAAIDAANQQGTGKAIARVGQEEPRRWETRLSAEDAARVVEQIERFAAVSPAAAATWPTSPAV
jgi:hypothetical protein